MENKTCGECKCYDMHGGCDKIPNTLWIHSTNIACIKFEAKNPTNGDRIRQMSNERLAGFISSRVECLAGALGIADCPGDQMDCVKCWGIWLNAPAGNDTNVPTNESEVNNG